MSYLFFSAIHEVQKLTNIACDRCTLTARNGEKIGWKPQYPPEHILEDTDKEVERVLTSLGD